MIKSISKDSMPKRTAVVIHLPLDVFLVILSLAMFKWPHLSLQYCLSQNYGSWCFSLLYLLLLESKIPFLFCRRPAGFDIGTREAQYFFSAVYCPPGRSLHLTWLLTLFVKYWEHYFLQNTDVLYLCYAENFPSGVRSYLVTSTGRFCLIWKPLKSIASKWAHLSEFLRLERSWSLL